MVLPLGVGNGQFDVNFLYGGREFELKIRLLQPLYDLHFLHRNLVGAESEEYRIQMYHRKVLKLEAYLNNFVRHRKTKKSNARIPQPFPVHHHIYKRDNRLWWETTVGWSKFTSRP